MRLYFRATEIRLLVRSGALEHTLAEGSLLRVVWKRGGRVTQTAPCTLELPESDVSALAAGLGLDRRSFFVGATGELSMVCTVFRRGGKGGGAESWEPKLATFSVLEVSEDDRSRRRERKLGLATIDLAQVVD